MIPASLSPRERRLVAVLILLALLALLVRGLILPIADGFAARAAAREQLAASYARNARLIGSAPRLARLAERQKRDLAAFLMTAPTQAIAGDALQERLQAAIERAGGEYRAGETLARDPDQVAVRVEARLTQAQLLACLAALENTPPWLAIDAIGISAVGALTSSTPGPMDIRLDVSVPFLAGA